MLKVALALAGAVLVDAYSDQKPRPRKALEPAEIRGVPSRGMVCSERELGLSDEHDSILLLSEDAPVGKPLREVLGGEVLEIALTPDLARCMSVIGVAREVAALTGAALRLPAAAAHPETREDGATREAGATGETMEVDVEVEIADPGRCNRYMAAMVRGVAIGPSPAWMRERLRAAGMQPISNVVDVTNYVMLEYGQPLHAFDHDLLASRAAATGLPRPSIRVRPAAPGEKITTLDGVERALDGAELLIADSAGPLGVAGVMGGSESGIGADTRNVLLEAATFDAVAVRQASRQLKLHTEASSRFTRGVPATLNEVAVRRAAGLLERLAGGRFAGLVDRYPVPQAPRRACLTASEVRRQLGLALELPEIRGCLERLEFTVETLAPAEAAGVTVAASAAGAAPGQAVKRASGCGSSRGRPCCSAPRPGIAWTWRCRRP